MKKAEDRLYHVIVINNKTKKKVYMTGYPVDHKTAMILLSKLTKYSWRTEMVEEVA